jgi:hypothetical protein
VLENEPKPESDLFAVKYGYLELPDDGSAEVNAGRYPTERANSLCLQA